MKVVCVCVYSNFVSNSAIKQALYMFLAKTSCFIVVTISLTVKNRFRLVKLIGWSIPVDSETFIHDEQAIDRFNLESSFNSFKPGESWTD
jgi:hypothetical protein